MKELKKILSKFNFNDLKRYTLFIIILFITIITVSTVKLTQARYETNTRVRINPSLAFMLVDVTTTSGQIKLESIIPSSTPYLYTFNVSNFKENRRANVDLTYSIEIITTTNMPLNFRIFKGQNLSQNEIDSDTFTTDEDGMYYRHLVIDDVSVMPYDTNTTDVYTLWVEFPLSYQAYPDLYAGIIDLVDIKINSEQVVWVWKK